MASRSASPEDTASQDHSTHAGRNPSQYQQQIRVLTQNSLSTAQKATRSLRLASTHEKAEELHTALDIVLTRHTAELEALAKEHDTKVEYIHKLTSHSSRYKTKRAVTIQNAKLHFKSLEINADLGLGERIKMAELRQLVTDDPAYQNLTTEEEDKMKQVVLEHREKKKVGARSTNKSAAQDYRAHMTRMNAEINALSERTGAAVVAFFSRSNLEDTFEPNWICSSNASNFTQEAMNYGMWDISRLLEQWTCAKAKGSCTVNTLSTMQKECSKIINGTLKTVSQSKQALMNYANYDAKVVDRYHTKLVGWTYHEFKSPFDIHTIDDIRLLLEALQCGSCFWARMTKNEVSRHKEELDKRRAAGETVGKPRQLRSDKGTKRPRKKAPGVGEGDNVEEPPAKKQKRPRTTEKAPKKSKRNQLPPARPTSNEFVASDVDDDI